LTDFSIGQEISSTFAESGLQYFDDINNFSNFSFNRVKIAWVIIAMFAMMIILSFWGSAKDWNYKHKGKMVFTTKEIIEMEEKLNHSKHHKKRKSTLKKTKKSHKSLPEIDDGFDNSYQNLQIQEIEIGEKLEEAAPRKLSYDLTSPSKKPSHLKRRTIAAPPKVVRSRSRSEDSEEDENDRDHAEQLEEGFKNYLGDGSKSSPLKKRKRRKTVVVKSKKLGSGKKDDFK